MSGCDTLDLNGIGKIQGYGYLVSLDKDSLEVEHASSNVCDLPFCVSDTVEGVIGCGTRSCFSEEASAHMESMIETLDSRSDEPGTTLYSIDSYIEVGGTTYMLSVEETLSEYVFSIHEDSPPSYNIGTAYAHLIQSMLSSKTQKALFEETCMAITDMVGYERAIVYKFKEDLSGEVIYEWIEPTMHGKIESYMGMHFPESDIPLPARQMYLIRPIRVIHDTSSKPIQVVGSRSLDMSKCVLRANHDVHTTYMKTMGVKSSLSIAIILDSDLWGILSFHSYRHVCLPTRSTPRMIESISGPLSMVLKNMLRDDYISREKSLSKVLDKLLEYEDTKKYFSDNHLEILKITDTDSIHMGLGETMYSWGDMDKELVLDDMKKIKKKASRSGFYIGSLKKPLRGVTLILHGTVSILLYRKTADTRTIWGGDPNHVKIKRPDGVPGPRGSFERYVLKNKGVLRPWSPGDNDLIRFMSDRIHIYMESKRLSKSIAPSNPANPADNPVTYNSMDVRDVDSYLLTHISHDIFTPLNGISSTMRIVMEDRDISRGDIETLMGQGLDCVQSMKSTMEGVLSITGADAHSRDATETPTAKISNIDDIGDSVVNRYSSIMKNKGITFSYGNSVGRDHSTLLSHDISTITRCVFAAIDNSICFTESGGSVSYTVSYRHTHRESILAWRESVSAFANKHVTNMDKLVAEDDTRTWYTFTVKDTGSGIHKDMMNNVVATIDKSSDVTGRDIEYSHQGIGIGMYKGMLDVLKMNGTVGIATTTDVGTSISFILPISEGVDHVLAEVTPGVTDGVFFVVDDSSLNRTMTSRLLKMACKKSLGFEPHIREFSDGKVCLMEVCKMQEVGEKPLCIIMDYHMPVMSGKEATEHIRRVEEEKGVKKITIVGYTADITERTRKDLLSSGMNTVMAKPISMDLLTEICKKVYGGNG